MNINNKALFENTPVNKAVLSLILPTVISQLITVIYNVADTFFIGQLGDPAQVAAVSLWHCAGVISAVSDNNKGICGISNAKLMDTFVVGNTIKMIPQTRREIISAATKR